MNAVRRLQTALRSAGWLRQLPNAITAVRVLLVPLIVALLLARDYAPAFWLLLVSAASDFADGVLARRLDARTRFGAIADPLADKLTMLAVAVLLAAQGVIPVWLAVAIALRDAVIVVGALAYHRWCGAVDMAPTRLSKLNTLLEFAALATALGDAAGVLTLPRWEQLLFALVGVSVAASGLQYVWVWSRRAQAARRDSARR